METYISIDVETNGPIPGKNSLLSIGATAFLKDGTDLGEFYINLELLPGSLPHKDTIDFWNKFPDMYRATRENQVNPKVAMDKFKEWMYQFHKHPVAVCSGFDYTWIYWYFENFHEYSPFGYASLDPITYAKCLFGKSWQKSRKKYWPWKVDFVHCHYALEDAREQMAYMKLMFEERELIENANRLLGEVRKW